jgi:hypothetical protein
MKLGLVFTNDWELFGDGSGDYFEVQHNPMLETLEMISKLGAKITIMAEVGQQFAYLKLSDSQPDAKKISESWEKILEDTVRHNFDVQLHFHPQWLNSNYENGKWNLDMEHWAISSLPPESINNILIEGKNYLESLLQKIKPNYKCIAFRAGAYCIQPSNEVIDSLKKTGFLADTSVTKGLVSEGFYDFKDAYSNIIPWFVEDDINKQGEKNEGILEMPIYSIYNYDSQAFKKYFPSLYYRIKFSTKLKEYELAWQNKREKVKNLRYPRSQRFYKANVNKNLNWYLSAILSKQAIQLDYDFLPPGVFVKMLKSIYNINEVKKYKNEDIILPVVATGHIKDSYNCNNLKWILEKINLELPDKVVYLTLSEAVNLWLERYK